MAEKISNQPPTSRSTKLEQLQTQIDRLESAHRTGYDEVVSWGCPAIDALLPDGGFRRGTLTQWLAPQGGCAATLLSLLAVKEACADGGTLVVIDSQRDFFPPAAAALGINLNQMVIVQTDEPNDLRWAIQQALGCPAVAAVWGNVHETDSRWQRRFQLAAKQTGAVGILTQRTASMRAASWAETQWLVRPMPSSILPAR